MVTAFYKRVGKHDLLIAIFSKDLTETARKQRLFLIPFFGGPRPYSEERDQQVMWKRYLPFPITPERRDAWLAGMEKALEEAEIEEPYGTSIFEKLTMTAHHMMNTPD